MVRPRDEARWQAAAGFLTRQLTFHKALRTIQYLTDRRLSDVDGILGAFRAAADKRLGAFPDISIIDERKGALREIDTLERLHDLRHSEESLLRWLAGHVAQYRRDMKSRGATINRDLRVHAAVMARALRTGEDDGDLDAGWYELEAARNMGTVAGHRYRVEKLRSQGCPEELIRSFELSLKRHRKLT